MVSAFPAEVNASAGAYRDEGSSMRQLCMAFAVAIGVTAFASPNLAQDGEAALTAAEIQFHILGHRFSGDFAREKGREIEGVAYFGTDGKFLLQVDRDREPIAVVLGTFELKDDQICVQQIGAMRDAIQDRCLKAFGDSKNGSWSGGLTDMQDSERGIPLDWQHDLDPAELASVWTNWEGLQKEAGPIDAFGSMEDIRINPFRFKGKVMLVIGEFKQMIGDGRALFRDNNYKDMIAEGVSNNLFLDDDETAILIGEFTGTFRMMVEGSDAFVPVMAVKTARICKERRCREYFYRWQ
jgi:hypothetical protein